MDIATHGGQTPPHPWGQRAFLIGTGFVLVAAAIAMLATNTRAREHAARLELLEAAPEEA